MPLAPWDVAQWWERHRDDRVIAYAKDQTAKRVMDGERTLLVIVLSAVALFAIGRTLRP